MTLVQAIEDYGHYTQKFLAEVNGWTLTDGKYQGLFTAMDEEAVHVLTEDDITDAKDSVSGLQFTKNKSNGVADVGLALNLDYETSVYIYITPEEGKTLTAGNVTLTQPVWDADAQQNKYVDFPFTLEQSGGDYVIKTGGIPAADLYTSSFALTAKFDGSTEDDIDYKFDPLVYAMAVLSAEGETYNDTWKKAMASLVRYSVAASDYQTSEKTYADMRLTYGYKGTAEEEFTFKYTKNNEEKTLTVPEGGQVLLYFEGNDDSQYGWVTLAFLDKDGNVIQDDNGNMTGKFSTYTCTHDDGNSFSASDTSVGSTFTFRLPDVIGKTFTQDEMLDRTGIPVEECLAKRVYGFIERAE